MPRVTIDLELDAARAQPPHEREGGNLYWSAMTAKTETASKACRCCGLSFAGGVPRIKMHLLGRVAGIQVRACTFNNTADEVKEEFLAIKVEAQRRFDQEHDARVQAAQRLDEETVADVTASAVASGVGFVPWELEMIIDEPDVDDDGDAPQPPRASPRLAEARARQDIRGATSASNGRGRGRGRLFA